MLMWTLKIRIHECTCFDCGEFMWLSGVSYVSFTLICLSVFVEGVCWCVHVSTRKCQILAIATFSDRWSTRWETDRKYIYDRTSLSSVSHGLILEQDVHWLFIYYTLTNIVKFVLCVTSLQINDSLAWICIPVYEPHPKISLLEVVEIQPRTLKSSLEKTSDPEGLTGPVVGDGCSQVYSQDDQREDVITEECRRNRRYGREEYSKMVDSDDERGREEEDREDCWSSSEEECSTSGYEKHFMPTALEILKVWWCLHIGSWTFKYVLYFFLMCRTFSIWKCDFRYWLSLSTLASTLCICLF